jgi:hypothetical protein
MSMKDRRYCNVFLKKPMFSNVCEYVQNIWTCLTMDIMYSILLPAQLEKGQIPSKNLGARKGSNSVEKLRFGVETF